MIRAVLRDIPCELLDLDGSSQVPLQRAVENLPLRRFQPIDDVWDGPRAVLQGELHQELLHKVVVGDLLVLSGVALGVLGTFENPLAAGICVHLAEGHFKRRFVGFLVVHKLNGVALDVCKILSRLRGGARPKALVVLCSKLLGLFLRERCGVLGVRLRRVE